MHTVYLSFTDLIFDNIENYYGTQNLNLAALLNFNILEKLEKEFDVMVSHYGENKERGRFLLFLDEKSKLEFQLRFG